MKLDDAAKKLSAIGHPIRLQVFRQLMQVGPQGMAAGDIAKRLKMAPSSLNFHLRALQQCGLVQSSQQGRFVIYTARFETMTSLLNYLTANCCGGNPCLPISSIAPSNQCPPKQSESSSPQISKPTKVESES